MRDASISLVLLAGLLASLQPVFSAKQQGPASAESKQQRRTDSQKPQVRPADVLQLLGVARSTPPEFAADVLITLATSRKVADPSWRKELLEEAFSLASSAQEAVPRGMAGGYDVDTRAGYLSVAFNTKLDALSLKCRAIAALLLIDKLTARELFREVPKLNPKPLSCQDGLVYDVSEFYSTLANVAMSTFSRTEMGRDEHIRFLQAYIEDVTSPVQVAPATQMVRSLAKISSVQRFLLLDSLSGALEKISGDDRSFSQSLFYIESEAERLVAVCEQDAINVTSFLRAVRSFYVKHLNAPRCSDTLSSEVRKGLIPREIESFNKLVATHNKHSREGEILPVSVDDTKPSKIEGSVDIHRYWQSPQSRRVLMGLKALKFGPNSKVGSIPLTAAQRETFEWRMNLQDFLAEFNRWTEDQEASSEDYFRPRCVAFRALLDLIPPGPDRDSVLMDLVRFIEDFNLQQGSRIMWFSEAKPLMNEIKAAEAARRSRAFEIVGITRSPVIYLYLETEKLLGEGPANTQSSIPSRTTVH